MKPAHGCWCVVFFSRSLPWCGEQVIFGTNFQSHPFLRDRRKKTAPSLIAMIAARLVGDGFPCVCVVSSRILFHTRFHFHYPFQWQWSAKFHWSGAKGERKLTSRIGDSVSIRAWFRTCHRHKYTHTHYEMMRPHVAGIPANGYSQFSTFFVLGVWENWTLFRTDDVCYHANMNSTKKPAKPRRKDASFDELVMGHRTEARENQPTMWEGSA